MTTHESILTALKNARATIATLGSSGDAVHQAQLAELDGCIAGLTKANPDESGFFWWLIAIGIHEQEVADSIDFTDERARRMLAQRYSLVHGGHLKAKVIGRPPDEAVAKAQGYESVAEYRARRGGQ